MSRTVRKLGVGIQTEISLPPISYWEDRGGWLFCKDIDGAVVAIISREGMVII